MPIKILAIDDSKTMRLAIKITFAAEDAEVTSVSKGSEALARAKQMGADVVLVDATLAQGEPSGYDVCRALKADAATARIPVIVMASSQTGVDQAKLRAVGADGHVLKPFETQELIDKVAEAIGKAAARPAAAVAAAAPAPAPVAAAPAPAPRPAAIQPASPAPRPAPAPAPPSPVVVAASKPAEPAARPQVTPPPSPAGPSSGPSPAVRLAPAATPATPARAPAPAPAPAQPAVAARADAQIPIAIPIPFVSADAPTPGILERLKNGGGAAAGLDPKVAAALVALSREVLEQVVWEVVPELAEEILRKEARARAG